MKQSNISLEHGSSKVEAMDGSLVMWLIVFVALAVFVVAFWYLFNVLFGRDEELEPVSSEAVEQSNSAAIADGRFNDLRFELVPRGYRQDQVDEVIRLLAERVNSASGAKDISEGDRPRWQQ